MIVIKVIILCSIFGGSTLIGIMISNKYKSRTMQLYEIKKALNFFEAKIEYTYEPLADIFIEISNTIKHEIGSIFKIAAIKMKEVSAEEAWEHSVDISQTNLNQKDLDIIRDFRKNIRTNRFTRTTWQNKINIRILRRTNIRSKGRRK